ncbi:MAG: membrane dipeptidase, partial [Lewinella sp.]|nr:membrane dipeptidase [Lewinella sp.]
MRRLLLILPILLLTGLLMAQSNGTTMTSDQDLRAKANELAHRFIITDGHVDLPYRLRVQNFQLTRDYIGIPIRTDDGDFDYERAKAGGLDAPFMS